MQGGVLAPEVPRMEGFHALPMPAKRWGSVLCWLATNYKVTAQKAVPAGAQFTCPRYSKHCMDNPQPSMA